jgi:hypothetical protein
MPQTEYDPFAPTPAHIYLPTPSTARSNPMDMLGFACCRIYMFASTPDARMDVTLKGAPNESGPYLQELGEHACQTGVVADTSFVLQHISRFLVIEVSNQSGSWTIWTVPMRT